jgi:hypothetical protein
MVRTAALLFILAASLIAAGCAHQAGGVAPSTIPLEPGGYTVLEEVTGQDCMYALLGILPISAGNETKHAVESAIGKVDGADALIGVTADTYSQSFIVVTRVCTQVQGTAVRSGS